MKLPSYKAMRCTFLSTAALIVLPVSAMSSQAIENKSETNAEVKKILQELKQQNTKMQLQQDSINEQRSKLDEQQKSLNKQRSEFLALKRKLEKVTGITVSSPAPKSQQNQYSDLAPSAGGEAPQVVGTDRKPETPEKPPEIATLYDEGGVLTPKGRAVVTPSIEYARSSATRVAIEGFSIIPALNIGTFEVSQVGRDTVTAAVGARVGVTNRLELEAKVPYLYRSDSVRSRPIGVGTPTDVTNEIDGADIGDIEIGAHYQVNKGQGGWPYFIGNLRFKTTTGTSPFEISTDPGTGLATELPTGSGFYALQPSVTAIYPSDPVVYFANLGYLHNFSKDFGGTTGEIEPGDSISAAFGMSLALNDESSFSIGYSHSTVFETKQNGQSLPNSVILQVGTLDLGYSYSLNDWMNLNLNVNAGLTDDAADSRVVFRVPMKFDLF